jgi:hypothetical protein
MKGGYLDRPCKVAVARFTVNKCQIPVSPEVRENRDLLPVSLLSVFTGVSVLLGLVCLHQGWPA